MAATSVKPRLDASARAAGSSNDRPRVVRTARRERWSSAASASAEPMPSPRRDGSTVTDRIPASGIRVPPGSGGVRPAEELAAVFPREERLLAPELERRRASDASPPR